MVFYHKGLRVRKTPLPFVACARKAAILRVQIWSAHESDVVGIKHIYLKTIYGRILARWYFNHPRLAWWFASFMVWNASFLPILKKAYSHPLFDKYSSLKFILIP